MPRRGAEDSCCALNRLQWVRNGLTLFTADDYNSKVLSERGGAGQRVGLQKQARGLHPTESPQNHLSYVRHDRPTFGLFPTYEPFLPPPVRKGRRALEVQVLALRALEDFE